MVVSMSGFFALNLDDISVSLVSKSPKLRRRLFVIGKRQLSIDRSSYDQDDGLLLQFGQIPMICVTHCQYGEKLHRKWYSFKRACGSA
ncbi:hypothetical protein M513_04076 [Trichuris suis]|uniref:Uncharacterized protein n=1 Tax=Trichuris suis TaxID=68888 RepID=A0A085MD62_9BILA|nr:hypothetical protein M513_04076 [Trichuris suis]